MAYYGNGSNYCINNYDVKLGEHFRWSYQISIFKKFIR